MQYILDTKSALLPNIAGAPSDDKLGSFFFFEMQIKPDH